MKANTTQKVLWMLGVLLVWGLAWALLGTRAAVIIKDQPHPFLDGVKLTGVMLNAVLVWALTALVVSLVIGLITGFISLVGIGEQDPSHVSFRKGCLIGAATLFWFHGVLYCLVPGALATLPWIKHMPMALAILIFLGAGAGLMARAVWTASRNLRWPRLFGILAALVLLILVPHDVFRRFMPGPPDLPTQKRRLMLVSFDALRRDTFERAMPEWKLSEGVTSVCALPATRMTWNVLFGAPVERMRFSKVMPSWREFQQPDDLTLLRTAELRGIRTAFVIDDSLTPAFGLQPNLFTTVLEPEGGWKYWFTLGFGTCWPVYSWAQNYLSPVETSNTWSDTNAYYRDIGRQLKNHNWVSSHNCELHAPIILRFEEIRALSGWKWLWRSSYSYKPYSSDSELRRDQGARVGPRANAQRHFEARSKFLLQRLKPFLETWGRDYPELSGLVTSDHGETFPGIVNEKNELLSTFTGIHGFTLEPEGIIIPIHGFGRTTWSFQPESVYSWLDLRDNIQAWLMSEAPLKLAPTQEGRVIQMPTIRAIHLERQRQEALSAKRAEEAKSAGSAVSLAPPAQPGKAGINPKDILSSTTFLPSGIWFCEDTSKETEKRLPLSTALVRGNHIITYNPEDEGVYYREDWKGYERTGRWKSSREQMDRDTAAFEKAHQLPDPPKE